ncbi:MAG TPA: hypothetical protein VFY84_00450 [Jiangellales bacterium]|nr:hypothetical protein [Jiangellales bacterium]
MDEIPRMAFRTTTRRSWLFRLGISDHELRGPLWRRATHGHYYFAPNNEDDPMRSIHNAIGFMPKDCAISGWAAAYLHGAQDLDGRRWSDGGRDPVLIVVPKHRQIRRKEFATVRAPLADAEVTTWGPALITKPERTCFEMMRRTSVEEAVVALDAMLRAGVVNLDGMRTFVAGKAGWNGVPIARTALDLADGRAASSPESRLRYVWQVEAGLPKPAVNVTVLDSHEHFAGIPDLLDEASGLVGEYDGSQHRELVQHTNDNAREERLEALGLIVVRATSVDLKSRRAQLVARLRSGHQRARSQRWRSWHT